MDSSRKFFTVLAALMVAMGLCGLYATLAAVTTDFELTTVQLNILWGVSILFAGATGWGSMYILETVAIVTSKRKETK